MEAEAAARRRPPSIALTRASSNAAGTPLFGSKRNSPKVPVKGSPGGSFKAGMGRGVPRGNSSPPPATTQASAPIPVVNYTILTKTPTSPPFFPIYFSKRLHPPPGALRRRNSCFTFTLSPRIVPFPATLHRDSANLPGATRPEERPNCEIQI